MKKILFLLLLPTLVFAQKYGRSSGGSQSAEEIEDLISPRLLGGTQTNITVTYDDASNAWNFVVTSTSGDSSWTSVQFDSAGAFNNGRIVITDDIVLNDSLTVNGEVIVNLDSTEAIKIDGATNERDATLGMVQISHTPGTVNTRAFTITSDVNSQGNLNSIVSDVTATGAASGDVIAGHLVQANQADATGGRLTAFRASTVEGGGALEVTGLFTTSGVDVFMSQSGEQVAPDYARKQFASSSGFTNIQTALGSTSIDSTLFENDNDLVYIGHDEQFGEIAVELETLASGGGIQPLFEYWNGSAWTSYNPVDGTNGMRADGSITWALDIISDWATTTVDGQLAYWVRITRQRNNLTTDPVEDRWRIAVTIEYSFDKDGDMVADSIAINQGTVGSYDLATYSAPFSISTGSALTDADEYFIELELNSFTIDSFFVMCDLGTVVIDSVEWSALTDAMSANGTNVTSGGVTATTTGVWTTSGSDFTIPSSSKLKIYLGTISASATKLAGLFVGKYD
jgi:hypothetical protein